MHPHVRKIAPWFVVATGAIAVAVLVARGSESDPEERIPIDIAALGPQIGERVPDFTLPDQDGREHSLQSILGPNGAMLLFHRSADW